MTCRFFVGRFGTSPREECGSGTKVRPPLRGVVLLAVASIDEAEHFILVATDDFHDPILSPPIQWPSADEVVAS